MTGGQVESTPRNSYLGGMPIYEFHCEECERDSEVLVRTADWRGTKCPECGSARLEKKLSVFASGGQSEDPAPACTGNPRACGRCAG